jgi:hypothetical protein
MLHPSFVPTWSEMLDVEKAVKEKFERHCIRDKKTNSGSGFRLEMIKLKKHQKNVSQMFN